jgi:putative ABC transport system substrate-binding protein
MKEELHSNGFIETENMVITERNADGDISKLQDLVEEILQTEVNIMIPFSTPAAQAVLVTTPVEIPVVFTIVTDPESAGVLNQRQNITGLSNATDLNSYINFAKRILPDLSIAGSIYNEQEENSVAVQQQLENIFPFYGIEFIHAAIDAIEDIPAAYQEVITGNAEVIMISNDNTMTHATSDLVAFAIEDTIPVLGTDYNNAQMGALATISVDYNLIARETARIAISVIRGVDPDELPVMFFETNIIAVNLQTAADLGYVFDPEILEEATYIYGARFMQ